jgi:hypothetical protein
MGMLSSKRCGCAITWLCDEVRHTAAQNCLLRMLLLPFMMLLLQWSLPLLLHVC